jgi:hypothetical protein
MEPCQQTPKRLLNAPAGAGRQSGLALPPSNTSAEINYPISYFFEKSSPAAFAHNLQTPPPTDKSDAKARP